MWCCVQWQWKLNLPTSLTLDSLLDHKSEQKPEPGFIPQQVNSSGEVLPVDDDGVRGRLVTVSTALLVAASTVEEKITSV